MITWCPATNSCSATTLPMYPAPPVTRTFIPGIPRFRSFQAAHAIGCHADVNLGLLAGFSLVTLGHLRLEHLHVVALHKINRTASESSASHSRPEHSVDSPRELDHYVQLATAHLKIVPQAGVRFPH